MGQFAVVVPQVELKLKFSIKEVITHFAHIEHTWSDYYHIIGRSFDHTQQTLTLLDRFYYQSLEFKRKLLTLQGQQVDSQKMAVQRNFQEEVTSLKNSIQLSHGGLSRKDRANLRDTLSLNLRHEILTQELYQKNQVSEILKSEDYNKILLSRQERLKLIQDKL